jgi:hypothetical protein
VTTAQCNNKVCNASPFTRGTLRFRLPLLLLTQSLMPIALMLLSPQLKLLQSIPLPSPVLLFAKTTHEAMQL